MNEYQKKDINKKQKKNSTNDQYLYDKQEQRFIHRSNKQNKKRIEDIRSEEYWEDWDQYE